MASLLVGTDVSSGSNISLNYWVGCRFQAIASGISTLFRIYSAVAGNAKFAIYADDASAPGNRLWHNSDGAACSIGWNEFDCIGVSIVLNEYYWLMFNGGTTGVGTRNANGTYIYQSATYSSFSFPDPAGTGFTSLSYTPNFSVYGNTGGWTHINKVNGISAANIANINGISSANISKLFGVAV
jgi:hypothetical protein